MGARTQIAGLLAAAASCSCCCSSPARSPTCRRRCSAPSSSPRPSGSSTPPPGAGSGHRPRRVHDRRRDDRRRHRRRRPQRDRLRRRALDRRRRPPQRAPHDAVLGWVERLGRWADVSVHRSARVVPGVVVYRLDDRLFFANASYVKARIREAVRGAPLTAELVLDAEGIDTRRQRGPRRPRRPLR